MSIRSFLFALPLACAAAFAAAPAEEHGVQRANMDTSVRPGDDFNLYANGTWLKTAVIPPDQAAWGSFSTLRDKASKRTADLIEDMAKKTAAPGSNEQKIGDYYASFMDEAGIEAKGPSAAEGRAGRHRRDFRCARPCPRARPFGARRCRCPQQHQFLHRESVRPVGRRRASTIRITTPPICCRAASACRTAPTTSAATRRSAILAAYKSTSPRS